AASNNEPIAGMNKNVWVVSTSKKSVHYQNIESTTTTLRLTNDGTSYFNNLLAKDEFFDLLQKQLADCIPINMNRLIPTKLSLSLFILTKENHKKTVNYENLENSENLYDEDFNSWSARNGGIVSLLSILTGAGVEILNCSIRNLVYLIYSQLYYPKKRSI
ncbi:21010_t:CDS:2, partial [Dentiscutata erythropus]